MPEIWEMSVVVVGVDDGPHSVAAFRRALKVFNKETTNYHLATVRPAETEYQIDEIYAVGFRDYWQEMDELRRKECQAILQKFKSMALEAGIKFTVVELQGDPREELCQYCNRVNADILVLGSRGSGFLQRLILGSVSAYCTHHAPCAVLVDRCSDEEAEAAVVALSPRAGAPTAAQPVTAAGS